MNNVIKPNAYSVFEEVLLNNDRLCFYFKFSLDQGITFAAKQQVDSKVTSIKGVSLINIFEWLGFNSLAYKLLESPKFTKRYKPNLNHVIGQKLCVLTLNSESHYMVFSEDGWHSYQSVSEHPFLQEEGIQKAIGDVMGKDFIANQEKHLLLVAQINNNFTQGVSEMRKFKQSLDEGKFSKPESNKENLLVIDINESTCSVLN